MSSSRVGRGSGRGRPVRERGRYSGFRRRKGSPTNHAGTRKKLRTFHARFTTKPRRLRQKGCNRRETIERKPTCRSSPSTPPSPASARSGASGRTAVTRILEVQGRAPGGGCNRARFVFSPEVHRDHPTPVGYLTDAGGSRPVADRLAAGRRVRGAPPDHRRGRAAAGALRDPRRPRGLPAPAGARPGGRDACGRSPRRSMAAATRRRPPSRCRSRNCGGTISSRFPRTAGSAAGRE